MTDQALAKLIDHTLLKPNVLDQQVIRLCEEAKEYEFASVCINPCFVSLASKLLTDSPVKVCTVIGFPLGANTVETKIAEARQAVQNGADELDYVLNISDVLNGHWDAVKNEMEKFVELRSGTEKPLLIKVILETCYLSDEQIAEACKRARETGLDFVKTSTGFGSGGAKIEHITLMRETVGPNLGVKASGGIRTYADAKAMVDAGASRIGASASIAIVTNTQNGKKSDY
jgi:deoxyribose-phosphate aldolase